MRNSATDIKNYIFKLTDELLLDANIWLSVYGPSKPGSWRAKVYSKALAKMLRARSKIYIDVLIVSEFINAYTRIEYSLQFPIGTRRPSFKQFRQSMDFKPIAADTRRILQHCKRVESEFDTLDITTLINEYGKGNSDFNDQVLAELCRSKGLTLVTHDGDFANVGLTVVTANRRLLI